jgi:hypothetical protein
MKKFLLLALMIRALAPGGAWAQDAHSMGIGGATTSAPMDVFGVVWNPALIALPGGPAPWTLGTGFSAFDTSNSNSPILRFNQDAALQSGIDPVNRYQDYTGLFTVRYTTGAGSVLFDQSLKTQTSQSAYQFFQARSNGPLSAGVSFNNLNYQETQQQMATLVLSYGQSLPFGMMPVYVGGSLKYEDGLQYLQNSLTGSFTQGGSSSTYQYNRTTSSNGLGLSIDAGFLAQLTDAIQLGMMFQNIQSNFSWTATQQTMSLNQATGQETVSSTAANQTVNANLPYITSLGLTASPQGKNIFLLGEVQWAPGQTNWKFGLERYYPENNMVVRLGTLNDPISQSQLWTFGWGVLTKVFTIDVAFETRSLPAIQNSIAVGGALDAEVRF